MTLHRITPEERADILARLTGPDPRSGMATMLFDDSLVAALAGSVAWLAGRLLLWAAARGGHVLPGPLACVLGWTSGLAVAVWVLVAGQARVRRQATRQAALRADLAHDMVKKQTSEVLALYRLPEPEHFSERLLLEVTRGVFRVVLDGHHDKHRRRRAEAVQPELASSDDSAAPSGLGPRGDALFWRPVAAAQGFAR